MRQTKAPSAIIVGILSAMFIQCGGEATPEPETPVMEAPPPPEPEPASGMEATEAPEPAPAAEPPPPPKPEPLTDEQILMVAEAVNAAEVDQAKVAQKKAKHARVKKFAAMLVKDHNAQKGKQTKLVAKLKLTPAESTLATELKTESESTLESLKEPKGADFDKAFIDSQVLVHRKLSEALESRMIPDAKNEEVKKMLEELKEKIDAHLQEAQEIQTVLAEAAQKAAEKAGDKAAAATPAAKQ
jgi:putative membrane protein